jgi:hypothetical protein
MTAPVGVDNVMYCLREDVKSALDVAETARSNRQIDRTIRSATLLIEGQLNRIFYPLTKTAYFDWPPVPSGNSSYPWRIWLESQELLTLTTLTSGGVVIPPSGYLLEPVNEGPPYNHVDINLGSSASFSSGATWQQSTSMLGVFSGYPANTLAAGALAVALTDTVGTAVVITDSAEIGVGSILLIGTERMIVTQRSMVSTGQTLQADIGSTISTVMVPVTDGTKYFIDEMLLIDAERMPIVDIAGNNLIVQRAQDGSVLAAHSTGATIYSPRQLTVIRGALGTTAATHLISAPIGTHIMPGAIRSLCVGQSMTELLNEESGYARTVGSGDSVRNASGAQLDKLWAKATTAHGRQMRLGVI